CFSRASGRIPKVADPRAQRSEEPDQDTMSKATRLFTSESVSPGHPDKVSDQISDGVVDACLAQDPESRVACETLCTTGLVVVAGEITTNAHVNYEEVARDAIKNIGYTDPST